MRQFLLLLLCLLLYSAVPAQSFEALVDPAASSSVFELDSELQTDGALLGDFDADSNPTGTQTRLGLAGGSGNMPIPVSLDVLSTSSGSSSPAGGFGLALDFAALSGTLSGLALDLAPDSVFPTDTLARLIYQTFRTVNPGCTFINIGPVTLPIGEIGQIRDLSVLQSEDAPMQIETTPEPDLYNVQAIIPALLSLVIDTSVGQDPLPLPNLPVVLPLSGSLRRVDPQRFEFQAMIEPQTLTGSLDLEGSELPPIPLALPCVLPPGEEAGLVLNLNANTLIFDLRFGIELAAEAVEQAQTDPMFADAFEQQ